MKIKCEYTMIDGTVKEVMRDDLYDIDLLNLLDNRRLTATVILIFDDGSKASYTRMDD